MSPVDDTDTTDSARASSGERSVLSPLTGGVLLVVALGWLSLYVLSLYHMLGAELSTNQGAIVQLALSLSGFFLGGTFAGAVLGLIWGEWSTHSKGVASYLSRPFMALFGAFLVAMAAGFTVFLLFLGDATVAGLLSGSLALSILLGGCLGVSRRPNPIAAGLVAFVPLLLLMAVRGYAMDPIFNLLEDMGNFDRLTGYQFSQAALNLVGGIVCGLVAFGFLRLSKRGGTLWTYMLAGAIPGLIWLVSEIFNGVTGHFLLNQVQNLHLLDIANRQIGLEAQITGALTVLFAGATTAVLAFGLLLPKPGEDNDEAAEETNEAALVNDATAEGQDQSDDITSDDESESPQSSPTESEDSTGDDASK